MRNLSGHEIHIWSFSIKQLKRHFSKKWEHLCTAILSEEEKKRASSIKVKSSRDTFMIGRAFLRRILALYLGLRPEQIEIEYSPMGKPHLAERLNSGFPANERLFFNLSHSKGVVAYAFTKGSEIGIDIEQIRTLADLDAMLDYNLSEKEQCFFKNHTEGFEKDDKKHSLFFKYWTHKEGYLKATGEGLSKSMKKVEFEIKKDSALRLSSIDGKTVQPHEWTVQSLCPCEGYTGALLFPETGKKVLYIS
jgi:4'-phosphopantetheinyl transferase